MWARLSCAWNLAGGNGALKRGDLTEAERCLREALRIAQERGWSGIEEKALSSLLILSSKIGTDPDCERYARRLTELRERHLGTEHRLVLDARVALASALQDREAWTEADALLRHDLLAIERAWGPRDIVLAGAMFFMARGCLRLGRLGEAVESGRRALEIVQDRAGHDGDLDLRIVDTLAKALTFAGQPGLAEPLLRKAVADTERRFGTSHPDLASRCKPKTACSSVIRALAAALGEQGMEFERLEMLKDAISERRSRPTSS